MNRSFRKANDRCSKGGKETKKMETEIAERTEVYVREKERERYGAIGE